MTKRWYQLLYSPAAARSGENLEYLTDWLRRLLEPILFFAQVVCVSFAVLVSPAIFFFRPLVPDTIVTSAAMFSFSTSLPRSFMNLVARVGHAEAGAPL